MTQNAGLRKYGTLTVQKHTHTHTHTKKKNKKKNIPKILKWTIVSKLMYNMDDILVCGM